jgi:hypothetical protein
MTALDIVVLGPEGAPRATLEDTVRRLGHSAVSADPTELRCTPQLGDVLMIDLRDEDRGWDDLTEDLLDDERPLVIVADRPRRMVSTLASRPAGTLLLTGAEDDGGYRVALTLCAALNSGSRRAARRRGAGGWSSAATYRAAAR